MQAMAKQRDYSFFLLYAPAEEEKKILQVAEWAENPHASPCIPWPVFFLYAMTFHFEILWTAEIRADGESRRSPLDSHGSCSFRNKKQNEKPYKHKQCCQGIYFWEVKPKLGVVLNLFFHGFF